MTSKPQINQWYIICGSLRCLVRASSPLAALLVSIRAENPKILARLFYASTKGYDDDNPLYGLTEWALRENGILDMPSDVELERARYDYFVQQCRTQEITEPLTFDGWRERWGGPVD